EITAIGSPNGPGSLPGTSTSNVQADIDSTCTSLDYGLFSTRPLAPLSCPSVASSLDTQQPSGSNWYSSSQTLSGVAQSGYGIATHAAYTQGLAPSHISIQLPSNSMRDLDSTVHTHAAALSSVALRTQSVDVLSSNCNWPPWDCSASRRDLALDSGCYSQSSVLGEGEAGGDDQEELKHILYVSPVMDSSVKDNFIPFALQNCAQWCLLVMFEPLKVSQSMKDHVMDQITSSDSSRAWMMLITKALRPLLKDPTPDQSCKFTVSILRAGVDQKTARYTSEHIYLEPDLAKQQALYLLNDYLDIISIQAPTYPLRFSYQLLQNAVPVFRRACPDHSGRPIYLPSLLRNPPFSRLYFVALDVATSVTSGRPMLCNYDPGFSIEICNQLFQSQHNYGFQWLFGAPDHYILLLAWINTLYERQGVNVEPCVLGQVEEALSEIRIPPVGSTDPALRVGGVAVQEGWRQAVYIYLYMTLYGANAEDQRVERVRVTFMRLLNGTNPGRNPDGFLVIPMMIAGVVLLKKRDRNVLRERILGLRECRNPESAWNDNVRILEDVWFRTTAEGRPAIWSGLRIAFHKVIGI
ncbi:unnamed protein product, partial [Rhizoctonia solani]